MKYPPRKLFVFRSDQDSGNTVNWLYNHLQRKTIRYWQNIWTCDLYVLIRPTDEELILVKLTKGGKEVEDTFPLLHKFSRYRPRKKKNET